MSFLHISGKPAVIDNLYATLASAKAFKAYKIVAECISELMTAPIILHNGISLLMSKYILDESMDFLKIIECTSLENSLIVLIKYIKRLRAPLPVGLIFT